MLCKYLYGIGWFILSLFASVVNDVIGKYVGTRLSSMEVSFFRFVFSVLVIIPFVFCSKHTIKTERIWIHFLRGLLLFCGISAWIYGLTTVPIATATTISFTIPLFTLILATFFLRENITWSRWVATIIGFIGIIITLKVYSISFDPHTLIFFIASIAFASLDIINKKFIMQESMISMLFYSALFTALIALPIAAYSWQMPSIHELVLLFILGASSNIILFLLLQAFALVDATAIAPYRYLELIISSAAGYMIFHELPDKHTIYGALIIIPATLFAGYYEKNTK